MIPVDCYQELDWYLKLLEYKRQFQTSDELLLNVDLENLLLDLTDEMKRRMRAKGKESI
jgi:hypothetical protein